MTEQGDVALLDDPVAQELLQAPIPCRLSYNWTDGTPRIVPIWFHWDGSDIVMASGSEAPKWKALSDGAKVAVSIDTNEYPHKVLLVRGTAAIDEVDGVAPEYEKAAYRCLGQEGGSGFVEMARNTFTRMVRLKVRPHWVGILDFETRFPSALSKAMSG